MNEWFATNIGAADELTADYRSPRRRAADCGGAGRTATGIGRGKGIERLLQQNGEISRDADVGAQRTQRNSGRSRARASLCKWTFWCTRRSGCDSGLPIASLCLAKFSTRYPRVSVRDSRLHGSSCRSMCPRRCSRSRCKRSPRPSSISSRTRRSRGRGSP